MDTLTILWIVIIVGAMVNSYVSKARNARKARQEGGNPPPQHGEAWPSIPWDEEDSTKPSVPTANTRPETPARTAPSAETVQSVNGGRRRPNREKNTPLSSIHPTVQETCNPGNNRQKDGKSGDQHPVSETFTDKCQSLEEIFSYNVTGEQVMILRTIPLVFKTLGLRGIYNMHAKANTATVTNLGNIEVAPEYRDYVETFGVLLSRSKGQNVKMSLSSYNGVLTATITSVLRDTKLQRAFFRYLASQNITVTIESNGVYYE